MSRCRCSDDVEQQRRESTAPVHRWNAVICLRLFCHRIRPKPTSGQDPGYHQQHHPLPPGLKGLFLPLPRHDERQ